MDDTDRTLLAALRRNARLGISDLATVAGVSRATVRARLQAMTGRGDIRGYTVLTPEDVEAAPVRGLTMIEVEGTGTERVMRQLLGFPEVTHVHSTNGKWDLIAELGTGSLDTLDSVLFAIRRIPGVAASETSLLLSTRRGTKT